MKFVVLVRVGNKSRLFIFVPIEMKYLCRERTGKL